MVVNTSIYCQEPGLSDDAEQERYKRKRSKKKKKHPRRKRLALPDPDKASDSDTPRSSQSLQASDSQERIEEPGSRGVSDQVNDESVGEEGNADTDVCRSLNNSDQENLTLEKKSPVNELKNSPNSTQSMQRLCPDEQKDSEPGILQDPGSVTDTASSATLSKTQTVDKYSYLAHQGGENFNVGDNAHEQEIKDDLVENLSKMEDLKETSKNIKSPLEMDLDIHTDTVDLHPTDKSVSNISIAEAPSTGTSQEHQDVLMQSPPPTPPPTLSSKHNQPLKGHIPPNAGSMTHKLVHEKTVRINSEGWDQGESAQDASPANEQPLEDLKVTSKECTSEGMIAI